MPAAAVDIFITRIHNHIIATWHKLIILRGVHGGGAVAVRGPFLPAHLLPCVRVNATVATAAATAPRHVPLSRWRGSLPGPILGAPMNAVTMVGIVFYFFVRFHTTAPDTSIQRSAFWRLCPWPLSSQCPMGFCP